MQSRAREFGVTIAFDKHITGRGRSRLDFSTLLREHVQRTKGERTWMYLSGPSGFMDNGKQACVDLVWEMKGSRKKVDGKGQHGDLDWYCAQWDV